MDNLNIGTIDLHNSPPSLIACQHPHPKKAPGEMATQQQRKKAARAEQRKRAKKAKREKEERFVLPSPDSQLQH